MKKLFLILALALITFSTLSHSNVSINHLALANVSHCGDGDNDRDDQNCSQNPPPCGDGDNDKDDQNCNPQPSSTPTPTNNPGNPGNPGGGSDGGSTGGGKFVCTLGAPGSTILVSLVKVGPNSVKLTWNAVPGATDYTIEYGQKSNNYVYGVPSTGNQTSYVINSLDLNKVYFFRVIADNGCAQGDPSNELQTAFGGAILGLSNTSSSDSSSLLFVLSVGLFLSGSTLLVKALKK